MTELLEALLDIIDLLDKEEESTASRISKNKILTTCGYDRLGEKNPIKTDEVEAWVNLKSQYATAIQNGNTVWAQTIRPMLLVKTYDLVGRQFNSRNQKALFDMLSSRWKI